MTDERREALKKLVKRRNTTPQACAERISETSKLVNQRRDTIKTRAA